MNKTTLTCFALAGLVVGGCGYQVTGTGSPNQSIGYSRDADESAETPAAAGGYQWKSLYRGDVQTVAVPVFTNRSFRRGIEADLTRATIQQLELHTPYKVVPRDRADTILEATIEAAQTNTLSDNSTTGLPQEQLYTISISFTWKNLRTGAILVQRRNFDQRTSFFATLGESESVGELDATNRLGLSIVQEMQADW